MTTLDHEIELLRRRAQAVIAHAPQLNASQPEELVDAVRLVEELRVYQTELEIQNQDLKSAQLQTEAAMRKYRRMFENLPLESVIVDSQGFIVEANAVARERFNLHRQVALQRRSVYQLFAFASRSALYAALCNGLEVASASQCQLLTDSHGHTAEVDAHIITIDPASLMNEERMLVLVDRTTERQLAIEHEQVLSNQRILHTAIEALDEAFVLYDAQDQLVFCNEKYKTLYATSADLIVAGAKFEDLLRVGAERGQYLDAVGRIDDWVAERMAAHRASNITITQRIDSGQTLRILERRTEDGYTVGFRVDVTAIVQATEAALSANQNYHNLLSAASEVSIIATDIHGVIQLFNRGAERMLGYTAAEMVGKRSADSIHLESEISQRAAQLQHVLGDRVVGFKVFTALADRDGQEHREWTYVRSNGEQLYVSLVVTAVRSGSGEITGYLGIAQNITQSKLAQAAMQLNASVFTYAREGILIADPQGNIIDVNAAFSRITGYARSEAIGKNPRFLKSGRQDAEFYRAMWQSLRSQGHWEGEIWNRRKDGAVYAELLSISAVHDSHQRLVNYVALLTDISLQKAHERELEHIARYDVLTGLPNRALLADRLQQEMAHCLRRQTQLAVVFIDLDGFKQVNDQHGHDIGDELLIVLAHRMKAALREGDTLSRIGGDEFVGVLTGMDQTQDCELVLSRLLAAAAEPVQVFGLNLQVSASLGVTLYPQDAVAADQLLRHADHAMYQAKQAGKNRRHYFEHAASPLPTGVQP